VDETMLAKQVVADKIAAYPLGLVD